MLPDAMTIFDRCHLFARVTGQSRERLERMVLLRQYQRGELVFRQGDPCPGVFIVGSGLVRIFKTAPSGKEYVLHMVAPGQTFAEVATIGTFDCPAFAEALEDSTCALLPAGEFTRALREDHQLCLQLMMGMCGWVKHLIGLVEDIALRDAMGRVSRYLLSAAGDDHTVQLPILKKHLASHLNLTSETLSRCLRRLSDLGCIESTKDEGLIIHDPQTLEELAQGQ